MTLKIMTKLELVRELRSIAHSADPRARLTLKSAIAIANWFKQQQG